MTTTTNEEYKVEKISLSSTSPLFHAATLEIALQRIHGHGVIVLRTTIDKHDFDRFLHLAGRRFEVRSDEAG